MNILRFLTLLTTVSTVSTFHFLALFITPAAFSQPEPSKKDVFEVCLIPSGSMLPTLQVNDYMLIDKQAYQSKSPKRGDLILFNPNEVLQKQNFHDAFIKRIIGLPGEKIEVKEGRVYVNGQPLSEKYIEDKPQYNYGPVTVPKNQYFVLGDNRNNSYDSHFWGFLPLELIIGQAVRIVEPPNRQRELDNTRKQRERSAEELFIRNLPRDFFNTRKQRMCLAFIPIKTHPGQRTTKHFSKPQ